MTNKDRHYLLCKMRHLAPTRDLTISIVPDEGAVMEHVVRHINQDMFVEMMMFVAV